MSTEQEEHPEAATTPAAVTVSNEDIAQALAKGLDAVLSGYWREVLAGRVRHALEAKDREHRAELQKAIATAIEQARHEHPQVSQASQVSQADSRERARGIAAILRGLNANPHTIDHVEKLIATAIEEARREERRLALEQRDQWAVAVDVEAGRLRDELASTERARELYREKWEIAEREIGRLRGELVATQEKLRVAREALVQIGKECQEHKHLVSELGETTRRSLCLIDVPTAAEGEAR